MAIWIFYSCTNLTDYSKDIAICKHVIDGPNDPNQTGNVIQRICFKALALDQFCDRLQRHNQAKNTKASDAWNEQFLMWVWCNCLFLKGLTSFAFSWSLYLHFAAFGKCHRPPLPLHMCFKSHRDPSRSSFRRFHCCVCLFWHLAAFSSNRSFRSPSCLCETMALLKCFQKKNWQLRCWHCIFIDVIVFHSFFRCLMCKSDTLEAYAEWWIGSKWLPNNSLMEYGAK